MKRIHSRPNAMRFGILSAAFVLGLLLVAPLARALPSGFISEGKADANIPFLLHDDLEILEFLT